MATEITLGMVRPLLPLRPPDAHKGTFGHVFVIAGSRGFTGAAKMCCDAVLRSGAGLVTAGVPAPLGDIIGAAFYEAMSLLLPATTGESLSSEAVEPALAFARDKEAVVLGPGLSQHPDTREFALQFAAQCPAPLLIDADGLNALSKDMDVLLDPPAPRILTPHPGEMARLVGSSTDDVVNDREAIAGTFVSHYPCTLVLKGRHTLVAGRNAAGGIELFFNSTGNSGLATGGTGDVLSGLIGGLLAQGMNMMDAARLGVYVHGLAGDLAAAGKTQRGMIASDVVAALPAVWHLMEQEWPQND